MNFNTQHQIERFLGIKNLWLKRERDNLSIPLVLVSVDDDGWQCICQQIERENCYLGFTIKDMVYQFKVKVKEVPQKDKTIKVEFIEQLPRQVTEKQEQLIQINSNAERRRGTRYSIGLKNNKWDIFGLKSPRQHLLLDKKSIEVVLSDVSSHGALVTGQFISYIGIKKSVIHLQVDFKDETIVLDAIVVRIDRPITELGRYALSFTTPSLSWMKRVNEYAQLTEYMIR